MAWHRADMGQCDRESKDILIPTKVFDCTKLILTSVGRVYCPGGRNLGFPQGERNR